MRSPPATLLSAAEASSVATLDDPAQPKLGGGLFAARRRGDRKNGGMSTYGPLSGHLFDRCNAAFGGKAGIAMNGKVSLARQIPLVRFVGERRR